MYQQFLDDNFFNLDGEDLAEVKRLFDAVYNALYQNHAATQTEKQQSPPQDLTSLKTQMK